jgi:SAM-dependent MidA family methyltransferase
MSTVLVLICFNIEIYFKKTALLLKTMPKQLEEKIIGLINENGPLRFKEFMHLALYDAEFGFYQKNVEIGSKNKCHSQCDFKTYPETYSPSFGISLARLVSKLSNSIDSKEIEILEVGAGNGTMAKDFLDYLLFIRSPLFERLRYKIIEISEKLSAKQKSLLSGFGNVEIIKKDCFDYDYGVFTGFIITNELLDAFPIDLLTFQKKEPYLMYISKDEDNNFEAIFEPCKDEEILSYLNEGEYFKCKKALSQSYYSNPFATTTPINLDMLKWYELATQSLKQGAIITIDYGFTNLKKYLHEVSKGYFTYPSGKLFRVFSRTNDSSNLHSQSPLKLVGEQDMTSDVDFSLVEKCGINNGLNTIFIGSQKKIIPEPCDQNSKGYYTLIQGKNINPFLITP